MSKILKKSVAVATLMTVATPLLPAFADYSTPEKKLTKEEVQTPMVFSDPTGRVNFKITTEYDGTGHGTTAQSPVNTLNSIQTGGGLTSFKFGDDEAQDGVVSSGDKIGYKISYNAQESEVETKITLRLTTENKNTDGTVNGNTNFNTDEWRTFCQGGTGYYHTGQMTSADTCVLTFPASKSSGSSDSKILTVNTENRTPGNDYISTLRANINNGQTIYAPHSTYVVSAKAVDSRLKRIGKPTVEVIDGKAYYSNKVALQFSQPWATKGYTSNHGYNIYNANGSIHLGTKGVDDSLPVGTLVETNNSALKWDGSNSINIDNLAFTPESHSYQDNATLETYSFTIKIPVSSINDSGNVDFDANIEKILMNISDNSIKKYPTYYNGKEEFAINKGMYLNMENYQPGQGLPKEYKTSQDLFAQPSTDYNNNDYIRILFDVPKHGEWFKNVYKDNNGVPGIQIDTFTKPEKKSTSILSKNDSYWVGVGAKPFAGDYNETMYCDVWDNTKQVVDNTREVKALSYQDGQYAPIGYTIEYGYNPNVQEHNSTIVGNTTATINATQRENCLTDPTVSWSSESTEETNMFRIVFDNHSGITNTDNAVREGAVHIAYVPFKFKDATALANYPSMTNVDDSVIFRNNNYWSNDRDIARVWVSGNTVDAYVAQPGGKQNAGTTNVIPFSGNMGVAINELNQNENFSFTPEYKMTISSAYSSINLPPSFYDKYEITHISDANFGNDGLPGTSDDVSDWIIEFKLKTPIDNTTTDKTFEDIRLSSDNNQVFNITGTLPGYLEDGKKLPITLELTNPNTELDDVSNNNKKTGEIVVSSSKTVSQSKWALKNYEMVGDRVGWAISWSNKSTSETGAYETVDVLPYNGDGRGTKLSKPLSDVQFNLKNVDTDTKISVTDADPKTITKENISNGTIKFVPLAEKDTLNGEITAYKIYEDSLAVNSTRLIEVTASTKGSSDNDILFNNLNEATVLNFALPVPSTIPVQTKLFTTLIDGYIFYDIDKDGIMDNNEPKRFSDTEIKLFDRDGNVVSTTVSDENGHYSFPDVRIGTYKIVISKDGKNIQETWVKTSGDSKDASVSSLNPKVSANFGYWGGIEPGIEIEKSIENFNPAVDNIIWGDSHKFIFKVTNTGNDNINPIPFIKDNVLGDIECNVPELAPGESWTCETTSSITGNKLRLLENGFDPNPKPLDIVSTLGYNPGDKDYYTGEVLCPGDSTEPCLSGNKIVSIGFTRDGNLIPGYGEWGENFDSFSSKDRVSIIEFNKDTLKPIEGKETVPVGSEAMNNIKTINNVTYIPTTDPSDKGKGSGVWTNVNNKWEFIKSNGFNMIHVFDTEIIGNKIYMAGSIPSGGSGKGVILEGELNEAKNGIVGNMKILVSDENTSPYSRIYQLTYSAKDNSIYYYSEYAGSPIVSKINMDTKEITDILYINGNLSKVLRANDSVYVVIPSENRVINVTNPEIQIDSSNIDKIAHSYSDGENLYVFTTDGRISKLVHNKFEELGKYETINSVNMPMKEVIYNIVGSFAVKDNIAYIGDNSGNISKVQLSN